MVFLKLIIKEVLQLLISELIKPGIGAIKRKTKRKKEKKAAKGKTEEFKNAKSKKDIADKFSNLP